MEFASLIAEFGAHYGMDCLAPDENGAVGFEADARNRMVIRQYDSDLFHCSEFEKGYPSGMENTARVPADADDSNLKSPFSRRTRSAMPSSP